MGYDAAGDITNDGKNQYLYNADGKICAVEWTYNSITVMTGYIYDAEGNRVAKGAITTMSCDPSANGFTTQADYVLDQAGHQLSEFVPGQNGAMAWQHTNVYASGELIATDDTTETHYYLNDWLGTRRVQTDYEGVVEQTCASLPYGDGETCAPTPTENLFTGKERDAESGNDYFFARYYSLSMGRFLSPDWAAVPWAIPYADLTNPQSLNLYEFGANNPLRFRDLDGHWHQECQDNNTTSSGADGAIHVTVKEHCSNVPDFWDHQWWRNPLRNTVHQSQRAWNNTIKFANSPRGKLLGKSIKHLTIGGLKAGTAVAGVAAAPETGGASLALTVYGGFGATGDLTAGTSELLGAIFADDSDLANVSQAGDVVADVTTVSGATALVVTGGNVDAANHAAAIEDIVVTGGAAGFTGNAPNLGDLLGFGDDTQDLSSSPDN